MTMTLLTIAATITTYTLILSITINVALYKQIEDNNREIKELKETKTCCAGSNDHQ